MKSKLLRTTIFFIAISLAALLLILWFVDYSPFNLPEKISGLELRPYGILIFISVILIFIFLQKSLLKANTQISVLKLVIVSTIVSFTSFLLYQLIRQLVILREQYSYDLTSVLLTTLISTIVSILLATSVALDLRKVKGIWRHVPTVLIIILLFLTKQYIHQFEW
jgi:FtsH-binding integral membrane protein